MTYKFNIDDRVQATLPDGVYSGVVRQLAGSEDEPRYTVDLRVNGGRRTLSVAENKLTAL
jgi:hypothetical protein